MVALQTRNQGTGNIVVTHELTTALFNSSWDKGELLDLPRQLLERAGESCATCSSSWLLMLILHTYTLLMLLFLSFVFPCAVWKATPFSIVPVTVFEHIFISHFPPWSICLCPAEQIKRRAASCDSKGWGMPQAASHRRQRWTFLLHTVQAVSGIPRQFHRNFGILMKEMQVSLLPLLLSEMSINESVMSCCCVIPVITGENPKSHREKVKPWSYSSPECWGQDDIQHWAQKQFPGRIKLLWRGGLPFPCRPFLAKLCIHSLIRKESFDCGI